MAAGVNLDSNAAVQLARLDDTPVTAPGDAKTVADAAGPPAHVIQTSSTAVKFVIPVDVGNGVFAYRITTPDGVVSGLLNCPNVWWAQGDAGIQATPGGWVRLFGRCLKSREEKVADTTVALQGPQTFLVKATGDEYAVKVTMPDDIPLGDYRVYVHNGAGGNAAWSNPVTVTIVKRTPWPETVFNVKDFGAKADGTSDDTAALQAALTAVEKNGGGVVYLPRGRYQVNGTLSLPPMTVLRGEKREWVCVFWKDTEDPPLALVKGSHSFGIEDLTIQATNCKHVIVGNQPPDDSGDVHLRRVRVRANAYRGQLKVEEADRRLRESLKLSTGGGDTVRLGGPNVEITDCDLYGSGRVLYLSKVRGGFVRGNNLYNGRWGWYCLSGSDGLIFEDNTITGADLMSTGGGINCLDGSPYSQNVYYARNKLRTLYGWDCEAMTSDAGGEAFAGAPDRVEGKTLILPKAPKWEKRDWRGAAVFILDGKGAGQYRRVTGWKGRRVVVDRPWDIEPDAGSFMSITMVQEHYLILDNELVDTGALQFYGTSVDCIVAGNSATRTQGIRGLGLWYNGYQPSWYCQFLDNRILEGNYYLWSTVQDAVLEISGDAPNQAFPGPLNRATILRGNQLSGNAHIRIAVCRDAVVEKNTVSDSDLGIHITKRSSDILLRENTFRNITEEIRDERSQP